MGFVRDTCSEASRKIEVGRNSHKFVSNNNSLLILSAMFSLIQSHHLQCLQSIGDSSWSLLVPWPPQAAKLEAHIVLHSWDFWDVRVYNALSSAAQMLSRTWLYPALFLRGEMADPVEKSPNLRCNYLPTAGCIRRMTGNPLLGLPPDTVIRL